MHAQARRSARRARRACERRPLRAPDRRLCTRRAATRRLRLRFWWPSSGHEHFGSSRSALLSGIPPEQAGHATRRSRAFPSGAVESANARAATTDDPGDAFNRRKKLGADLRRGRLSPGRRQHAALVPHARHRRWRGVHRLEGSEKMTTRHPRSTSAGRGSRRSSRRTVSRAPISVTNQRARAEVEDPMASFVPYTIPELLVPAGDIIPKMEQAARRSHCGPTTSRPTRPVPTS